MGENGSEICFESGKATMWLGADGILHLVWTRNSTLLLEDAVEAIKTGEVLSGGRSLPLLVEINGNHLTPELREHTLKHGTASAVATVGVTSTDRVQAAWMRRNSSIPQAYFTRREDAVEWIAALPHEGSPGASRSLRLPDSTGSATAMRSLEPC
ncbi:hypothetical protein [Arthrobacter sp. ISL-69]|uniref:DUF7793 family protein n=1 Tax=Arthrobacter sp. ISL-69 TaxID=2819113 RepID=UPI001BE54481|nr:hypothetical protein [Arthrobacter sp. ISL-69]MBT2538857.1 hypothetical protein [Arthrobacter sp. ISL-69]